MGREHRRRWKAREGEGRGSRLTLRCPVLPDIPVASSLFRIQRGKCSCRSAALCLSLFSQPRRYHSHYSDSTHYQMLDCCCCLSSLLLSNCCYCCCCCEGHGLCCTCYLVMKCSDYRISSSQSYCCCCCWCCLSLNLN